MKKFYFAFLLLGLISGSFGAIKPLPEDFSPSCFEKYGKLNLSGTTKVLSTQAVDVFVKNSGIVPWKLYKIAWEKLVYQTNLSGNIDFLQDKNIKTYLTIDTDQITEIVLSFQEKIEPDSVVFDFKYQSNYYKPQFYISLDWQKFSLVKDITQFPFKYFKIKFVPVDSQNPVREKIKIYELGFYRKYYTYIVYGTWNIVAYALNACPWNWNFTNLNGNFAIDVFTPTAFLTLQPNPLFNPIYKKDTDKDWWPDENDNCPTIFNPDQKDSDGDGKGDACSDVDSDGIVGYLDNCPYVYNPDQKDINANGVWDACEFDKDNDGVPDGIDNCKTVPNPDQKDSDKDSIWDACDNCPYDYNPRQIDKNNNWIWDVCEEKQKFQEENDKDKDWIVDFKDNCPSIYNPDQKDKDKDWVWDACDNCVDIQNPDQTDKNNNWVGDICEDVDGDGIVGYLDNCPYIANPDQKDSDNDWIGDVCEDDDWDWIVAKFDNCPYDYNPDQRDIDGDWIGDVCDDKDDRFLESNRVVFVALLVLLVVVFGAGIVYMLKQLNKND